MDYDTKNTFVPLNAIRCECCKKLYYTYMVVKYMYDADNPDDFTADNRNGYINRVKCRKCDCVYTYETPVLLYTMKYKTFAAANAKSRYIDKCDYALISKLCKADDYNFRMTDFASEAIEKIRIFSCGLDDMKTELLKLKSFPKYRNMNLLHEYITFDTIKDNMLCFSQRYYTDIILNRYEVPLSDYLSINYDTSDTPTGIWIKLNRDTAIKYMEEHNV